MRVALGPAVRIRGLLVMWMVRTWNSNTEIGVVFDEADLRKGDIAVDRPKFEHVQRLFAHFPDMPTFFSSIWGTDRIPKMVAFIERMENRQLTQDEVHHPWVTEMREHLAHISQANGPAEIEQSLDIIHAMFDWLSDVFREGDTLPNPNLYLRKRSPWVVSTST